MGDALVVRDEFSRALMLLEPWTVEWSITALLAFLLVSSVTLNLLLLWKLRIRRRTWPAIFLTKYGSVYRADATCEHMRNGFKALRQCKVCACRQTAA